MAATRRRFEPRDLSRRRVWVYIAVALFLLVDIALIVWALSSTRASAEDAAGDRMPAESAGPAASADAPDPSASVQAAPVATVAPTRILAALDDSTAWRATTGPCPTAPARPEITTDGGASWTVTDAAAAGITAVQSIDVVSADIAAVLGLAADDCTPRLARTFVAGADFDVAPDLLQTTWRLDPADPSVVIAPAGASAAPCSSPVVIAPRDASSAAVLCSDQNVHATEDGGESWSANTPLTGALDLAETESGYIAVAAGDRECAGVQVTQLDASLARGTSGCLPLNLSASTFSGNVAIAQGVGAIWVWAGERVWRSGDGGATWQ